MQLKVAFFLIVMGKSPFLRFFGKLKNSIEKL